MRILDHCREDQTIGLTSTMTRTNGRASGICELPLSIPRLDGTLEEGSPNPLRAPAASLETGALLSNNAQRLRVRRDLCPQDRLLDGADSAFPRKDARRIICRAPDSRGLPRRTATYLQGAVCGRRALTRR